MNLLNTDIEQLIQQAQTSTQTYPTAQLISLLDLTSLNDNDDENVIQTLCQRATTPQSNVAAVCIYPQFVSTAYNFLKNTGIKIATVANFPNGNDHLNATLKSIEHSIAAHADEIDVVMPYHAFMAGDTALIEKFILACKEMCGTAVTLKVILETGALEKSDLIYSASRLVIENGADFVKTSTGKVEVNATLEAAAYILLAIKDAGRPVGFKAAGGIRTLQQAHSYLYLAESIMGKDWINAQTLRLGASSLLDVVLEI